MYRYKSNQHFDNICRAMEDASFYPHPTTGIEIRETHISTVFLTGSFVYKLKKPVCLDFLDFRTLQDREFYCRREVLLNQRLTQGVYIDVSAIYLHHDGSYGFEPEGEPVEYAVKMRQLPEAAGFGNLIRQNAVRPSDMERIGRRLADFYAASQKSDAIDHFGENDVISANMEENFRQLAPFSNIISDKEKWEFIRMVSGIFLETGTPLFQKRIGQGFIRDGHGDLRTDHIYFDKGLQIIDCIEFNDRFRYGDAALDLSFLHMDLEHQGYPDISRKILLEYMKRSRDFGVYSALDFYAAYRAIVRLKVSCMQITTDDAARQNGLKLEINRYVNQAYRYAVQFARQTLWIFCGLPGSGKSTLAQEIADANRMPVFGSDSIRKQIQGFDQSVATYGQGEYSPDRRSRVYAHILGQAQEVIKSGHSAVIDASFSMQKWRDEARRFAGDLDADIVFVYCFCGESSTRARLKEREHKKNISDARIEHLKDMTDHFEPLKDIPDAFLISVSTDQPITDTLAQIISEAYQSKSLQVHMRLNLCSETAFAKLL